MENKVLLCPFDSQPKENQANKIKPKKSVFQCHDFKSTVLTVERQLQDIKRYAPKMLLNFQLLDL